jgi:hypothetical protein
VEGYFCVRVLLMEWMGGGLHRLGRHDCGCVVWGDLVVE